MTRTKKAQATWADVKASLQGFDRDDLQSLVKDLYAASKDNKAFLNARLNLGADQLQPYKDVISRWMKPDVTRNQLYSVAKAKKAITDYKKAIGTPSALAELSIFYCEEVFDFLDFCSVDDEGYYTALMRMYAQAVKYVLQSETAEQAPFIDRLDELRSRARDIGWGVSYDFDELWYKADLDRHERH
ncbi:MAG: DUF6155 family protein [Pseudomonadota bacterium]